MRFKHVSGFKTNAFESFRATQKMKCQVDPPKRSKQPFSIYLVQHFISKKQTPNLKLALLITPGDSETIMKKKNIKKI